MAQKKEVKVKDLKPTKDAKGGAARQMDASRSRSADRGGSRSADRGGSRSADGAARRSTL